MEIENPALTTVGEPTNLLAALKGARPAAPDWVAALAARPPEAGFVEVDGVAIEYFAWGRPGAPGLLLTHGIRAHARWWGLVAPLLAQAGYRVIAMSFSGHGGSGWRESYRMDQQGAEMFAVARAAGLDRNDARFFVGAHSFGGLTAICALAGREAALAGVFLVDSAFTPQHLEPGAHVARKSRPYLSEAEALARFRLAPPQTCDNLYVVDEIARQGLIQEQGVWRWRFDPFYFDSLVRSDAWGALASTSTRLAVFYGELSAIVTGERLKRFREQAPPSTPFVGIPQAGHHVMLDQPLALTAAVRTLLGCWQQNAAAECPPQILTTSNIKNGGNND